MDFVALPRSPSKHGVSRADAVYLQLKQDIADFKLLPGDRFSENEICERLQVSRTPVRQALALLQQEGYVEVQFRSGWRVLPFDFEQFEQLYDLRMVLETTAVQRLCRREASIDTHILSELLAIWRVSEADRCRDGLMVAKWDEAFHCSLVLAAGNLEMAKVHKEVTERIRVIRRLDFTQDNRIDATYTEHAKILQAIQAQRADQATLLLKSHIQTSQSEVRKITLHQLYMARSSNQSSLP